MRQLPRTIKLAHASAGRTRLRLSWLHRRPEEADAVADALADVDGMIEVRARAATGSVLCLHQPAQLTAEEIVTRVVAITGATVVRPQVESKSSASDAGAGERSVARALMNGVRGLDEDLRAVTSGRLDLGTLAAASFLTLGAAEVMATRKLPMPPWFNLAWWAFRTFTAFEHPDGVPNADPIAELDADPS